MKPCPGEYLDIWINFELCYSPLMNVCCLSAEDNPKDGFNVFGLFSAKDALNVAAWITLCFAHYEKRCHATWPGLLVPCYFCMKGRKKSIMAERQEQFHIPVSYFISQSPLPKLLEYSNPHRVAAILGLVLLHLRRLVKYALPPHMWCLLCEVLPPLPRVHQPWLFLIHLSGFEKKSGSQGQPIPEAN